MGLNEFLIFWGFVELQPCQSNMLAPARKHGNRYFSSEHGDVHSRDLTTSERCCDEQGCVEIGRRCKLHLGWFCRHQRHFRCAGLPDYGFFREVLWKVHLWSSPLWPSGSLMAIPKTLHALWRARLDRICSVEDDTNVHSNVTFYSPQRIHRPNHGWIFRHIIGIHLRFDSVFRLCVHHV